MGEPEHGRLLGPEKQSIRLNTVLIIVLLTAAIIISRSLTLSHNMALHPDERVFVDSSVSMLRALIHQEYSYEEVKPYPEGAFVLQMPFHAIQYAIAGLAGTEQNSYLWGRIAGVSYFVIGWLIGAAIMYTYFCKSSLCLLIYGLTMCFSLFQIEQSRYGTGDPITFALLYLLIYCTARALKKKKKRWFYLSCITAGMIGAVKYPLILFALIPLIALRLLWRSEKDRWGYADGIGGILLVVCGFLILSPKVVQDWHYLQRVFESETAQYLRGESISEVGGPANHLLSVVIYHFLYSDIPFGSVFFIIGIVIFHRNALLSAAEETDVLFEKLIPAVVLLFLGYNLFVPLLYFRTLYPFFCVSILYSSYAIGNWILVAGGKRTAAIVIATVMICRGSYLIGLMTENHPTNYLMTLSETYTADREQRVIFLEPIQLRGLYVPGKIMRPEASETIQIDRFPDQESGIPELRPGDLVITANFDFGRAQRYLLPVSNPTVNQLIGAWERFKKVNEPYLKAETYPKEIYYLFGYWLKGSSAGSLEFPENAIYYRDLEQ